ncbi:MAG: hypothetical protein U1F25_14170 [Rubrivivax sp.]
MTGALAPRWREAERLAQAQRCSRRRGIDGEVGRLRLQRAFSNSRTALKATGSSTAGGAVGWIVGPLVEEIVGC